LVDRHYAPFLEATVRSTEWCVDQASLLAYYATPEKVHSIMTFTTLGLAGVVLIAAPLHRSGSGTNALREHIERSLSFLEKGAVEWVQTKKCVTCHHVPMMLWTHYEARRQGFHVNDAAVQELESQAIAQYLAHPDFTPTGQDTGFMEKLLGPGTVYLALALKANAAPSSAVTQALERFRGNFVARQNENGSWTTKVNQPPLVDQHDSMTMLILTAFDEANHSDTNREARERAVRWLKETPARDESQALVLRILVAVQSGDGDAVSRHLQQLRSSQHEDGGWSQVAGAATDALATGQALYALSIAGVKSEDTAIQRACQFLLSTQQEDGSWLVRTRNPNGHDPIISFYGTGWATLGLIRTVPPPAK
jgi:hypothetical protein